MTVEFGPAVADLSSGDSRVAESASDVSAEPGRDAGVHRLIELRARLTPDAVALESETRTLTFAELDARASRLADRLVRSGVGPGTLVGLFAGRGVAAVVGMLGILKSGGAFVPFDPTYPKERLAFMLHDALPRVVVARTGLEGELPVGPGEVVTLDEASPLSNDPSTPGAAVGPDATAYAIYTSGSTGRPKAALLTHRGLRYLVSGQTEAFRVTLSSRVLQFAPLGFDAAVSEIFVTLSAGATLCLAEPARLVPGVELSETLRSRRVTLVTLPPTILARMSDAGLPDLETVVVAGERCPADVAGRWSVGRRFLNAYGPTEATVCATVHECPRGPQPPPPIGRPLPGCEAFVLDDAMRPVPDGEPGELYLGGPGVASGYLNRPTLTAARFVPYPTSIARGVRLYRTGDRVRRRADGVFEFLDRLDDQVKIRGVRIEPGEVAAALERHPSVAAAAVVAEEDPAGGRRLVAYVAHSPDRTGVVRELYDHLRESLPLAMLPSAIVPLPLDRWPLSPSGKVDRKALRDAAGPALIENEVVAHAGLTGPRDAIEYQISEAWAEVLDGRPAGVTDDFFELGGDSLAALDLAARIERRLGILVATAALVESPTIEGLARVLRRRVDPTGWSPLVPLRTAGSRRPLFCVHPGGGGVLCYVGLARALGADQPVYALQAPGVDGVRPIIDRVERMAEEYLTAIRTVRPIGPYDLCGWSFGGVVAYEMARRLRAEGEEVASLTLIESGFMYSFAVLRSLLPGRFPVYAPAEADRADLLPGFCEFADRAGIVPPGAGQAQAEQALEVFLANVSALLEYKPDPYPGGATLLLGDETVVPAKYDPAAEWRHLCRAVEIDRLPGDHLTLLRPPHVGPLAARIARAVAQGGGR